MTTKNPPLLPKHLPRGFRLYGLRCGISAVPGKKDLALFLAERKARAVGVFTTNRVKAAPVTLCQKHLQASGAWARAVIINSGCANACTGEAGDRDALVTAQILAAGLGARASQILVSSTGVIGRRLPMGRLIAGVRRLVSSEKPSVQNAVRAIMTTDTVPKAARAAFSFGGKTFTVWGCAKGAGMIHPRMATMLSVVLTDAGLPAKVLHRLLKEAADATFNRVSVDGDTSTNDSLFLLASGDAGASPSPVLVERFARALLSVCASLAEQIAADGEGATRLARFVIKGASSWKAANVLAATVATSPLVKTALNGADPNWGRILAALGRAGVAFNPGLAEVRFGKVTVCKGGVAARYSERAAHQELKKDRVTITVDLHQGPGQSHYLACDFSKEYVTVNADYTT